MASTSAPANAASHRRSTPPATGQRWRITVVIGGQRWWSTTIVGDEPPLTAAGPPLTTTGQRWLVGRSTSGFGPGLGRVWIGSGSGPPRGMPRVSNVCTRVSHVCPRGIHVAADVDIKQQEGVEPGFEEGKITHSLAWQRIVFVAMASVSSVFGCLPN
nr:hypothetical protein [Tanacetum cinerariifolium]